jgi:hypothetical protein
MVQDTCVRHHIYVMFLSIRDIGVMRWLCRSAVQERNLAQIQIVIFYVLQLVL